MEIAQRVIKEQEEQRKREESLKKTENDSSVNFSTSPGNGESPVDLINVMNKWALIEDIRGAEGVGNVMEIYSNYMKAAANLEDSSKVSRGTLAIIKEIEIGDEGNLVDGIYIKNHQAEDTGITVGFGENIKLNMQTDYKDRYNISDFTENGKVDIITATYLLVEHVDNDYGVISENLPNLNQNQLEALVYMRYLTGNVVPEAKEIKANKYQIGRSELRNVFIQHLSKNNNYNVNKDGWEERVEKALDLYYTPIS